MTPVRSPDPIRGMCSPWGDVFRLAAIAIGAEAVVVTILLAVLWVLW